MTNNKVLKVQIRRYRSLVGGPWTLPVLSIEHVRGNLWKVKMGESFPVYGPEASLPEIIKKLKDYYGAIRLST